MHRIKVRVNALVVLFYNWVIRGRVINSNNKIFRRIRAALFHNVCYECEACFGKENPTRRFYVIRCPQSTLGFFGLYNYVVSHIKRAKELGCEPIVDWKHYPNTSVTTIETLGKENAWDIFFEPMLDISLDEVYSSKNVWMSSGESGVSLGEVHCEKELLYSKELIERYMRPSKRILERLDKKYNDFKMDDREILGVLCRGTDFAASQPQYHAICPSAEQTIDIIEEKMVEWGYYEYIFVATEDKTILSILRDKYGDRLLVNQKTLIDYSGNKWLNEVYEDINSQMCFDITIEYFVSILLLSKCDALIAPLVGGTLGAMRIKGKYDKLYLTRLGTYE